MYFKDTDILDEGSRTNWLLKVATDFKQKIIDKFLKGQVEHGCDIGRVSTSALLDNLEEEHLDASCYLFELRRRMTTADALRSAVGDFLADKSVENLNKLKKTYEATQPQVPKTETVQEPVAASA